jgi:hypothetical protein
MIDRSIFDSTEPVKVLRIPVTEMPLVVKHPGLEKFLRSIPGRKSILACPQEPKSYRLVLVENEIPADVLSQKNVTLTSTEVKTSYENYSAEFVLRKLLNCDGDPPTSFETIGYVNMYQTLHFNQAYRPHEST